MKIYKVEEGFNYGELINEDYFTSETDAIELYRKE